MLDTWQGTGLEARTSLAVVPPELVVPGLTVVAAFLLGVAVIVCLERWRRRREAPPTPEANLETFRTLHEQGQISREEFERIRARLAAGEAPPRETDS